MGRGWATPECASREMEEKQGFPGKKGHIDFPVPDGTPCPCHGLCFSSSGSFAGP